jgi:hypothetical protein
MGQGGAEGPERGAQRRVGGVWGGSPSPALEVRGYYPGKFFEFVIQIRAFLCLFAVVCSFSKCLFFIFFFTQNMC